MTPSRPTTAAPAPSPSSGSSSPPGATGLMSPAATRASRTDPAATASSARRSAVVPERSDPVMSADRDRKIDDGGQERRVGLLDVRRRGRGEEAGADAARLASGHRVERRLGRHGERVLVVVGHGALAAGAPAPHLSERLA